MVLGRRHVGLGLIAGALFGLSGCGTSSATGEGTRAPIEVAVITVVPSATPLASELPGRVEASRVAEVRARVPGIVLERVFTEGADVAEGDVLFRIDNAPYRAALQRAEASLARAEATKLQAESRAGRFERLSATQAVSQQEVDDAVGARAQAVADVAAAKAALVTARLDFGYATVTAPISGRIGRAEVTEGALVGQGTATRLAVIQRMDPVYVNLSQSLADLLRLRAALQGGSASEVELDQTAVTVLREDGTEYAHPGRLLFTDVSVDPATGAVSLRAEVPNPDGELLPGEFVRARVAQAVLQEGLTVPQAALLRTPEGASVYVVEEGKVVRRPVEVSREIGNSWLINSGLTGGEVVVVQGLQRVRPGTAVSTIPWE